LYIYLEKIFFSIEKLYVSINKCRQNYTNNQYTVATTDKNSYILFLFARIFFVISVCSSLRFWFTSIIYVTVKLLSRYIQLSSASFEASVIILYCSFFPLCVRRTSSFINRYIIIKKLLYIEKKTNLTDFILLY